VLDPSKSSRSPALTITHQDELDGLHAIGRIVARPRATGGASIAGWC